MAREKATIAEVADKAGVSVGTVSHVLSGHTKVSARLRQKVDRAIDQLGYVPNIHAQGLRQTKSKVIGLCLPHAATTYVTRLSERFEEIASNAGYSILHVFSRQLAENELRRVQELMRFRVDGLILFPSSSPQQTLEFIRAKKLPAVLIDRSDDPRFDQIVLDNAGTSREVADHLFNLGHRHIVLICRSRDLPTTQHRWKGLTAARTKHRAELKVSCITYGDDPNAIIEQLARLMRDPAPPTALISSNNQQAALTLDAMRGLGISCPDQMSLITFDDPDWSKLVVPSLSVIRQPDERIAKLAWELLLRRLARATGAPVHTALDADIEYRDSVGPAPRQTARARSLRAVKFS